MSSEKIRENFQQARWNEPIIFEMSKPNIRGVKPPKADKEIIDSVGDVASELPEGIRRKEAPGLPELSVKNVLSHYIRLSQETLGANLGNDISQGTCTMKYNPRINEALAAEKKFSELHPLQDEDTVQGILEIYYKFQNVVKEVSGLDKASLQPGGGSHAVYAAACIVREYWEEKGEADTRDEIITTIFSHPADAAAPATAGFKMVTIYPDEETGLPDIEALKAAVSERTAAIFMTNPEDLGIFNPKVDEFVDIVHDVGGLCFYDQANANAFLGVARAKEAGFDMCHFNVHKTFGTPHACSGPGTGALCVKEEFAKYLPAPIVEYDGEKYYLDYGNESSIGKVRDFAGVSGVVLKAYAWTMMMGAEGLRETADVSVINNNYLEKKLLAIPGINSAYQDNGIIRQEQIRYTFEKLKEETGVGSDDMNARIIDFGIPSFWQSHHPWLIPEPMTLEPCETYSKDDIDEYAAVLKRLSDEAYSDPEILKTAPHNSSSHRRNDMESLDDPEKWATTWAAYLKKHK